MIIKTIIGTESLAFGELLTQSRLLLPNSYNVNNLAKQ